MESKLAELKDAVLLGLQAQLAAVKDKIRAVEAMKGGKTSVMALSTPHAGRGRPPGSKNKTAAAAKASLSKAGAEAIRQAQLKRWARVRKEKAAAEKAKAAKKVARKAVKAKAPKKAVKKAAKKVTRATAKRTPKPKTQAPVPAQPDPATDTISADASAG